MYSFVSRISGGSRRRANYSGRTPSVTSVNAEEMTRLFADVPEAVANASGSSSRLEFTLEKLGYEFLRYRGIPGFETRETWGSGHRIS
jgi:DNA polymerase III alpha subunit